MLYDVLLPYRPLQKGCVHFFDISLSFAAVVSVCPELHFLAQAVSLACFLWHFGKSAMGKGGPRHFTKPMPDAGLLYGVLKENIEKVCDLGEYESLSRGSGISPQGLSANIVLLEKLVLVEPSAEIHSKAMAAALLRLLQDEPGVNKTKFSGNAWMNLRQERLTCILYHLRRLVRDQECMKTCAVRLCGSDYSRLKSLLLRIELRDTPEEKAKVAPAASPLKKGTL